ncbi:MAG: YihA family ribosome biogenesis GTP-binding protein [Clostridia bacterium]|nr:YihA family ribosome biogenesis GTP-binding protein [Clostridia bacterium]MBR6742286.1 YihA family ribosome biogenesis GTP-binding protein [Clostridia bacterium]
MIKINLQNSKLAVTAGLPKQFPRIAVPQIAFSGRSNVGKSSLMNTLLGRKSLARVSSTPGKTITVNFYDIDGKLFLVDLPGYGYAKRSPEEKKRWSALTDGYFTNNPQIDLLRGVIQLVDCRSGATDDDLMMIDFLSQSQIPFVVCVTKTDKLSKTALGESLDKIAEDCGVSRDELVPFSSLTKAGKDELWNKIFKLID